MAALSQRTESAEPMGGGAEEAQHVPLYAVS